jgi:two-component system, NarL family, sensor histidine kinase UhpB
MSSSSSSAGLTTTAAGPPDRTGPARADGDGDADPPVRRTPPADRVSLLWRVFAANTIVFVAAAALLAWTPATVHRVATPGELLVLAIGIALMLSVDLFLLRRAFGPLRRLAAVMSAVDPAAPGRRAEAPEGAGREVVALANALNAMLDRLEGERRESARRTLEAQEGERKRVARELHDEVGQTLTAIALRAERAGNGDAAEQSRALAEIADTVLQSLADVQRIGRELRPEALDDLGLINALIVLCRRIEGQARLHVRRSLDWSLPALSPEVELVIYRVAQEALTNVLRHSGATEVIVSLRQSERSVVLSVVDDGRGLPADVAEHGPQGMRERAMLIDAELIVGSGPAGAGTEIVLRIPIG